MNWQKIVNLIFYPIMVFCVLISTYASYYGLYQTLGQFTLPGAIVICLALFGSTLGINEAKRRGRGGLAGPMFLFGIVLIFSTASNFNYFYTRYLQLDLARGSFRNAVEGYKKDIEAAKTRFKADPKLTQVDALKADIDNLLEQVKAQATDPLRFGTGTLTRTHMAQIKVKLPSLTELALPSKKEALLEWYSRYDKLVRETLRNTATAQQKEYLQASDDMDRDYAYYESQVRGVEHAADAAFGVPDLLKEMRFKIVGYTAVVNKLVPGSQAWNPPYEIDPEAGRVGDIVRTWSSVFKDGGDFKVAIWSLIVSLFIDLMPIMYSFAVVRPAARFSEGEPGGEQEDDGGFKVMTG